MKAPELDEETRRRATDAGIPYAQLTAEEQLERVHQVVAIQDRRIAALQQIVDSLTRHQHAPSGELVTPLRFGMMEERRRDAPDPEAWF